MVDFGTAVTFDCVSGQAYLGGLIFPGPATALAALSREAAKLPRVNLDIRAQEPAPGRDTTTSIQHGLVFGFVCMVEGLTQRLKRQSRPDQGAGHRRLCRVHRQGEPGLRPCSARPVAGWPAASVL